MKKIIILFQLLALSLCFSSCEKEPYKASDVDFELVYRVFDRTYTDADGVHKQSDAQKAILTLDAVYQFFLYLDLPQVTTFSGPNYKGCKVEATENFVNNSEEGKNYSFSFDRNIDGMILTYTVFYDLDRTVYQRLKYEADGTPSADANGNPVYESYYKDSYLEIKNAAGEIVGRNDEIEVLIDYRAI